MMEKQLTLEEFNAKDELEQIDYIQKRLNLSYYPQVNPDCSENGALSGKRLIGFVMSYPAGIGNTTYYIHPIDLHSDEPFRRGVLFESPHGLFLVKDDKQSLNAVAAACRETVNSSGLGNGIEGKWMVSAEYKVPGKVAYPQDEDSKHWMRVRVTNVRVLEYTKEDLQAQIRDIIKQELELDSKANQLRRQLEDLTKEHGEQQQKLEREYGERQQELEQVKADIDAEQENLNQIRQRQRDENAKLSRIQGEIDKLNEAKNAAEVLQAQVRKLADRMLELGFELDLKSLGLELPQEKLPQVDQPHEAQGKHVPELPWLVARTRWELSQKGLDYEEHIVREFLGAMFSDQIIILSGPPGTGKSSLPPAIAKCIGAECRMVSVQPSWTDNQDLLGFYDPIRERFVATPFLEFLIEARDNPETIYLICLDEMNLVRVEYYFSEILSAMEMERKELLLYSRHAYDLREKTLNRQISAHIQPELDAPGLDAAQQQLKELQRYTATFSIPPNVQFVGTLNMDESTRELSPKVLDRSFIIEINRTVHIPEPPAYENIFKTHCIPDSFKKMPGVLSEDELDSRIKSLQELLEKIEALAGTEPQKVSASLSRRGLAHVRTLLYRGLDLDDIFLGKILPTLKYTDLELRYLTGLLNRNELSTALKKSREKLETIYDKELRELNYWR